MGRCSADIFSLGMLLHFIATRTHARRGMSRSLIKHVLRSGQPVSLYWPPDSTFQPYCKTLVESCLRVQEHLRPSAWEVHTAISSWSGAEELPTQAHDAISCTPARLKFPGFVETPLPTMMQSAISAARRWNHEIQGSPCCM